MSIRKRTWEWKGKQRTALGGRLPRRQGEAPAEDVQDQGRGRDWHAGTRIDLKQGTHMSPTATASRSGKPGDCGSPPAGRATATRSLERSTIEQYRRHVELHITPLIGTTKLNKLTVPSVRIFRDQLREAGRSAALTGSCSPACRASLLTHRNEGSPRATRCASASAAATPPRGKGSSSRLGWISPPQSKSAPFCRPPWALAGLLRDGGRVAGLQTIRVAGPSMARCGLRSGYRHRDASALTLGAI